MYIVLHNEQNNYLYLIEKDAAGEVGEVLQPYIYNCVSAPLNVLC